MGAATSALIGFKRHLRAETVPQDAVYLSSARGTTVLTGPSIRTLAPLLDGTLTLPELQRRAFPDCPADEVGRMLGMLTAANLVGFRRPGDESDARAEAYWDLAGVDVPGTRCGSVGITALGTVDAGQAEQACRDAGVSVDTGRPEKRLRMVLCDDYLDPDLESINRLHLMTGTPWLLVKPTGPDLWIGPLFRPGAGPCWACLAARLRLHRQGEACVRGALGTDGQDGLARIPEASLPGTRALGLRFAALEAAKWLAGRHAGMQDLLWTLDTVTLDGRHHRVEPRPQCGECGRPELVSGRARRPVTVQPRAKVVQSGNGHRAARLEQVWNRYSHLADPVTGITREVVRHPQTPSFLHCYLSGHNRALGSVRLAEHRAGLRSLSGGKGVTDLEAKVGALCEAVERYCGSRHGDEETIIDSFSGLGAEAVHPDACQLFHPRQFATRHRWNAENTSFQHVPERFDEEAVIEWTPVWSLTAGRERYLPTDLLYLRSRDGLPSVRADSNGNAAGSSQEDAILQGFLELVERDAVALWWYNRTRQRAVDLDSLDDAWILELQDRYGELKRRFWLLDITTDLGIPAMAAISRRVDKPAEDIMLGFGAHFDPQVAARRALTELGQLLPAVVHARADGSGYDSGNPSLRRWWTGATTANQPYLLPDPTRRPRTRPEYGYVHRADLRDDIDHILMLTERAGLDVLVLDQTRPDIGMPVVKVIVPGLRHFWARFAPGRLYDVPVRLGRLGRPTAYEDLNPIPMFL